MYVVSSLFQSNALALGYNCYLFQQTTKTWAAALGACQASGGNLAVIHDRYIAGRSGAFQLRACVTRKDDHQPDQPDT